MIKKFSNPSEAPIKRLHIFRENIYFYIEDGLEGNVDNMEDRGVEMRYGCHSKYIYIF